MYTRFKSQKSGLKLGMNSLANTTTTSSSRVAKSTSSSSSSATVNSLPTNKSQLMSSSTLSSATSGVGSTGSSIHHSSASSSTVSLTPSSSTQSINTLVNNLNSVETNHLLPSDPIVFNADIDFNNNEPVMHLHLPFDNKPVTTTIPLIINEDSDSQKIKSKKMARLAAGKKSNNQVLVENIEEPIDLNSVTYVKSKWEKVKSELDKDSGPQRYQLDDNSQYPHLSNFVAFDIENWWTERVFSSMINEETPVAKSNMTMNDTRPSSTKTADSVTVGSTNFKLDSQFLMSATARLTNGSSSYLKSKTTLNQDLIMNSRRLNSMDSSLRYFGNFQSCFS